MLGATMVVATLPVSDLERARAFYGETLGLTQLWENPASIRFRAGEVSELSVFRRPGLVTEHTLAHFAYEERLMQERNCPDTEAHQLQHRALIMQIRVLRTALIENVLEWNDEMIRLIRDWLLVHIIEADRPLGAYLRKFPAAPPPSAV